MTEQPTESLEDVWPLQAKLNARAGFDTQALGEELLAAEQAGGDLPDEVAVRIRRCTGIFRATPECVDLKP